MSGQLQNLHTDANSSSSGESAILDEKLSVFRPDGHIRPIHALEADIIRLAIRHYGGQMSEVARRLGIGRSTLYRKLSDLGIARTP